MTRRIVRRREKRKAARSRLDFGETWSGTAKPYRAGWLPWRDEDTVRFWAMVKRLKCRDRSRRNNGHDRWGQGLPALKPPPFPVEPFDP
jgi:hypothetical protein